LITIAAFVPAQLDLENRSYPLFLNQKSFENL